MSTAPILPPATIGLLGGGQLGRMTGYAALSMGYSVAALDPDESAPARAVAAHAVTAGFDDERAAAELAERSSVVTLEIEQISRVTLEAAARFAPVRPGPQVVWTIQDRGRQKEFLRDRGFPVGDFRVVEDAESAGRATAELGQSIVKSCFGGYDGRGQELASDDASGRSAFESVGGMRAVVEKFLDISLECSVVVARQAGGAIVTYAPAENVHTRGILTWSVHPGRVSPALAREARELAAAIADALDLEGLLAVEMFVLSDGRLLVNELAPRPHNTFHTSERSSVTSQFEQLVRAVCGLPLGATDVVQPSAIVNLLGDLWEDERGMDVEAALRVPGVRLHLYGKSSARPGRKMGHLSAVGATPDEALDAAHRAYVALSRGLKVGTFGPG